VKARALWIAVFAVCAACGTSSKQPPEGGGGAPAPRRDKAFDDLLKRADAEFAKKAPDAPSPAAAPQAPAGSTKTPSPAPARPTSTAPARAASPEEMMVRAQAAFAGRIGDLASRQQTMARLRVQEQDACTETAPASTPTLRQNKADSQECQRARLQFAGETAQFKRQRDALGADAARMGISTAVMRELYSRLGFNPN